MSAITWTKCSEALPDDEETVLLATDDGEVAVGFHEGNAWWEPTIIGMLELRAVTHWAHLPPHPDDGGEA